MEQNYYTIFELERKLLYLNRELFEQLLAVQFLEINEHGAILSKAKSIHALPTDANSTLPYVISNFKTIELAPTVVQTSYKTTHIESQVSLMRSSIWQLEQGIWQLVFHQKTEIK